MNNNNLRQVLSALADALEGQNSDSIFANPSKFIESLPKRSINGDYIYGGKILKFASAGITDSATKEQLIVSDNGVTINTLRTGLIQSDVKVDGVVTANSIKTDILEVKEIRADIKFEKDTPIVFSGDNISGKGMLWTGKGHTKQLIFSESPDRFFSSENLDLAKDCSFSINGIKVLSETELGNTVTKSNLREVGRLKGLIVDGSLSVNQYLFYDGHSDRLGIGTEQPNATLSIVDQDIELVFGASNPSTGSIGTFNSADLELVTDNSARLTIKSSGDIYLGNPNKAPIKVSVSGSVGVNLNSPDSRADLDVRGAIKFNNKIHLHGTQPPESGVFNEGDIVWNTNPTPGKFVGWVCVRAGSPGLWNGFGRIE